MMKHIFLLIIGCLLCGTAKAQHQNLFDEFRQEAGDQAEMFAGKIESGYPSTIYLNTPYWLSDEFLPGDVMYKGLLYQNVALRFDAYLHQLVVQTPVKQSNVCIPMHLVEKFVLGGTAYSRKNGEFMAVLVNTSRMELVEQMHVSLKEKLMGLAKVQYEFKRNVKYYVVRNGQMNEVDKIKSVLKLFPDLKKELKQFAKMRRLNFKEHRQSSLITLIRYADELTAQP